MTNFDSFIKQYVHLVMLVREKFVVALIGWLMLLKGKTLMAQFTNLFVKRVKFYSASAGNQNGKAKILGSAALCETF